MASDIYVEMTETEYLNFMAMIKRNEGKRRNRMFFIVRPIHCADFADNRLFRRGDLGLGRLWKHSA
jgi:hypothetical protein